MNVVLDFWGYSLPPGQYQLKEFCIINIAVNNFSAEFEIHGVFKAPYDYRHLPEYFQDLYFMKYVFYGIAWDYGFLNFDTQSHILLSHLQYTNNIFVRNEKHKYLLSRVIGSYKQESVICLTDLGFPRRNIFETDCPYHQFPEQSYYTIDNAKLMRTWLLNERTEVIRAVSWKRNRDMTDDDHDDGNIAKRYKIV